jgi:hypothetical protein
MIGLAHFLTQNTVYLPAVEHHQPSNFHDCVMPGWTIVVAIGSIAA